jgi:hypothetical protein
MADGLGAVLEKALLDAAFGATAFAATTPVFFAALTTMPTARDGTGLVECANANAYARLSVANTSANFSAATGTTNGSKALAVAQTFVTATGTWGTILGIGISKVSTLADNTAANWLGFITFTGSVTLAANNALQVSAGAAITVT